MKMNQQNPGGEIATRPTMKGCEKYMARGKGDLKTYTDSGQTKFALSRKGLEGKVPAGKARGY